MTLPSFVIIGAAKSGTTSLYQYLQEHPEIRMSRIKETNFFAYGDEYIERNWPQLSFPVTSLDEYEDQFSGAAAETVFGEASPIYLECSLAAVRMKKAIPRAKIVASLRDPVDRAVSDYFMHARKGLARGDFSDFDFGKRYVTGGFYFEKLRPYLELYSRDQIKILLLEDLRSAPDSVMADLYRFVGVDDGYRANTKQRHYVGKVPKYPRLNRFLTRSSGLRRLAPLLPRQARAAAARILRGTEESLPAAPREILERLFLLYRDSNRHLRDALQLDLSPWTRT